MTYVPIALSEVQSKAAGTTLASSAVGAANGSLFIGCTAYDDIAGHPTQVTWGNRKMANRPPAGTRDPGAIDIAMSLWIVPRIRRSTSHVLTTTWASSIDERAMAFGYIPARSRVDQAAGATFAAATTSPITQATAALAAADDVAVAYFVSEGPVGDTPGTMEILDGGVWTAVEGTQRVGTSGGGPATNVTIHIGWLKLTSSQATQARITGATSRSWTCAILTAEQGRDVHQAVVPTDVGDVEIIFEDLGIDPENAVFGYNPPIDEWEAFDRNNMGAGRVCHNQGGDGWIAG